METTVNSRKIQHLNIIKENPEVDRGKDYFSRIRLIHRALPEIDYNQIDTTVEFLGKKLSFPLIISSMTGGDHEVIRKVNRNLAIAAEKTGVALAVGSQRVMFTNDNARDSFRLRKYAPDILLFANLGAVQLNYGFGLSECREAVDILQADGLYFHFNPLQEAIQPEGEVNFSGLAARIGEIARKLKHPVIIKEVGAGISQPDVEILLDHGLNYIDVAGAGGTSWSRIEYHRRKKPKSKLGLIFQDWGIPTPLALMQMKKFLPRITLIASGGIRTGVDMVKSIVLGASLCGVARPFLSPAMESAEKVTDIINELKKEFQIAMFLLGKTSVKEIHNNSSLLLKEPEDFKE